MGALARCPACGDRELHAVTDGEMTNFLCERCGRCWHVELGYVSRVDPVTCPGCPFIDDCLARWAADPQWRPQDRASTTPHPERES